MDTALAAEAEKERTAQNVAKANDSRQGMDGKPQFDFSVKFGHNGFSLLMKVDALCRDIEGIEEFFH